MSLLTLTTGLRHLSDASLLQRSKFIYSQMHGNPLFPAPWPSMSNLLSAITDLSNELSAANHNPLHTNRIEEKRLALINILHLLGYYVQFVSAGNANIILMAGFAPIMEAPALNEKPVCRLVFNRKIPWIAPTRRIHDWLTRMAIN